MNERLNLQDLIELLAKKQEITKKEAEAFLRELIDLVSENIEKNEPVKIKDFGTFKLVKINARKSVDVNTGEAIEIPSHYRLNFTPEKSLKEAINRPFAHFESVVLEDGVSFDNVQSEIENTSPEDADVDDEYVVSQIVADRSDIVEQLSENHEVIDQSSNLEVDVERVVEHIDTIESEEPSGVETDEQEVTQNLSEIKSEANDTVLSEEERAVLNSASEWKNSVYKIPESENIDEFHKSSRKRYIRDVIIFLVIALSAVGIFFFDDLQTFISGDNSKSIAINNAVLLDTVVADCNKVIMDSLEADMARKRDSIALVMTTEEDIDKEIEEAEKRYAASSSLGTETIKPGQTLRLISLKYYGHKSFWVYIYEENKSKIKNPNNIPLGTELIIPRAEKYNIDPDNTESVKKAMNLEGKLIAEHNL